MRKTLLTVLKITHGLTVCLLQTGKITVNQWGFKTQMNSDYRCLKVTDLYNKFKQVFFKPNFENHALIRCDIKN